MSGLRKKGGRALQRFIGEGTVGAVEMPERIPMLILRRTARAFPRRQGEGIADQCLQLSLGRGIQEGHRFIQLARNAVFHLR